MFFSLRCLPALRVLAHPHIRPGNLSALLLLSLLADPLLKIWRLIISYCRQGVVLLTQDETSMNYLTSCVLSFQGPAEIIR
jgi:hypothetical protein